MATLQFLNNNNLDSSQEHTIDFPTLADQSNFWAGQVIGTPLSTSYSTSRLLANENIEVPIALEKLLSVNYLRYLQDNKWYYFFITDRIYINENTTALALELDVMQTFLFDFSVEESFVVREHQDRFKQSSSANYLEAIYNKEFENIETGENLALKKEFVIKDNVPADLVELTESTTSTFVWATIIAKEKLANDVSSITTIKGIPTNIFCYVAPLYFRPDGSVGVVEVDLNKTNNTETARPALSRTEFDELVQDPKIISISLSKYAPFKYTGSKSTFQLGTKYLVVPSLEGLEFEMVLYKNASASGTGAMFKMRDIKLQNWNQYSIDTQENYLVLKSLLNKNLPKNKNLEPKLNTNQFSNLILEMGENKLVLDLAGFKNQTKTIEMKPTYSIRGSQIFFVKDYLNNEISPTWKLLLDSSQNEMPLRTDAWLQYLSQNKNSLITGMKTQIATGLISSAITGITGGDFGAVSAVQSGVGVVSAIANNIAKIKDLKETPDQVSNPATDIAQSIIESDMNLKMRIYQREEQFINKAFEYFYVYGYRCNNIKVPNLKSRYYFNFIQTTGANIKSDLSNNIASRISAIFDKGITFWHWRDASFKGVHNYAYENVEMSLI